MEKNVYGGVTPLDQYEGSESLTQADHTSCSEGYPNLVHGQITSSVTVPARQGKPSFLIDLFKECSGVVKYPSYMAFPG